MTIEEAIRCLDRIVDDNGIYGTSSLTKHAIDALTMAISALESQQWIPTVERLPEDDETVIVYKPIAKGTPIELQIIQGWGIKTAIMSHWIPLPPLPKEES